MNDGEQWSIHHLGQALDPEVVPDTEDTRRLLQEFHGQWIHESNRVDLSSLINWLLQKLDISEYTWHNLQTALKFETVKLSHLNYFVQHNKMDSEGNVKMMLYECSNVISNIKYIFTHSSRLLVNMNPRNAQSRQWMAPDDLQTLDADNENMFRPDEKTLNNFQKLFFHLRPILEACQFRRAGDKFYSRIKCEGGYQANAYEEACTITEFVASHCSCDTNYHAWKWSTEPSHNFKAIVTYFTDRPILEAPDLEEDRRIRSYAGKADGTKAGIYNHYDDMFYPYDRADEWDTMAADVQRVRRSLFDPEYTCTPPEDSDVCMVHLDCEFPYDIYTEVMAIDPEKLYRTWVEVGEYQCRHVSFHPEAKLECPALSVLLVSKAQTLYPAGLNEKVFPRPRLHVSDDEWRVACGGRDMTVVARTFVVAGDQYFRVDTGKMWFDIPTEEIDQIYDCQAFIEHDRFMLWGVKGRIFFPVGLRDGYEGTIFYEGIGGSGKSTAIKAFQRFWPPHLWAVLSSNLQPQFGMAEVARGDVAVCTEISENPNIVQEEWQDANGGGSVSCPRKFLSNLQVDKWRAQFWWAGNSFPKGFNNRQGQVSRRLYGVAMYKAVNPRRDDILKLVRQKLGHVQRKAILAYEDWRMQWGNVDPNSQIDKLPPAFASYQRNTKRLTDPVMDFITDIEFIELGKDYTMPMHLFRQLYTEFRSHYEMGRAKSWGEDVYRMAFAEHGIMVMRTVDYVYEGQNLGDQSVIQGLRPAARHRSE